MHLNTVKEIEFKSQSELYIGNLPDDKYNHMIWLVKK